MWFLRSLLLSDLCEKLGALCPLKKITLRPGPGRDQPRGRDDAGDVAAIEAARKRCCGSGVW
jgi:hypothetical protein